MIKDIADFLEHYSQINPLTGTVLVAQGDDIVFVQGFGCADHNCQSQCGPETQYRIASITKQFIGAAALRLAEQGKLDLDAPIRDYMDLYPQSAANVSMHQLLTHTSGLPDYHGLPSYCQFKDRRYKSDDFVKLFSDLPLLAEPGTRYEYSGVGYALAGVTLEKITGKDLQSILNDEFFSTLEMHDTSLPYGGHVSDLQLEPKTHRLACGYNAEIHDFDRRLKVANTRDISTSYAGGGVVSTVYDLLKWNRALHSQNLLSPESYEKMLTPSLRNYGYGIGRSTSQILKQDVYWHSGGTEGFNSQLMYLPKYELTVCVLLNLEDGGAVSLSHRVSEKALKNLLPRDTAATT